MFELKYNVANDTKEYIVGDIIHAYLQKSIFYINSFCAYIAKNILFQKKEESNVVRTIIF